MQSPVPPLPARGARLAILLSVLVAGAGLAIDEPTIADFNGEMEPNPVEGEGDAYGILVDGAILGRMLDVELSGAVSAEADGAALRFDGSGDASGSALLSWDGEDEEPTVDPEGLGRADLTLEETGFEAQDAFLLRFSSVANGGSFAIEVISGEGEASRYAGVAAAGGVTEIVIPYSDFSPSQGGGARFDGVGAITLTVGGGLEAELDHFQTTAAPAAASATLVDALQVDLGAVGRVDPGDTLRYTFTIPASADGVWAWARCTLHPDTLLVNGSVTTTHGIVARGNRAGESRVLIAIGRLPASEVVITFDAVVASPFGGPSPVCNQFTFGATGLGPVLSDDPDDPTGNEDPTCTEIFIDTEPPVLTVPVDLTLDQGSDTSPASTGVATATDNVTADPVIDYSDVLGGGPVPFQQVITRTWTATDEAGNVAQGVQTITLRDVVDRGLAIGRPVYGLFSPSSGSGKRQLGTIDTAGNVVLLGTDASLDPGDISTGAGLTAFDRQTQTVFAIGRTASDNLSRVFSILGEDGSSSSAVLSAGAWNTVVGIWWDELSSTLFGVFQVGAGLANRQLATIDPDTGTVGFIGSEVTGIGGTINGIATGSTEAGEMYFLGTPGGLPGAIYTVDLGTGAMSAATLAGANYNGIAGIEFSECRGTLYGLLLEGGERRLAEIDPATGVVTPLGATTVGGGGVPILTYAGVNAIDENHDSFLFIGRYDNGMGNAWAIFGVDLATGDASFNEIDVSAITTHGYFGLEYGRFRANAVTIVDKGYIGSDFYIDVANGTEGLKVTSSDDLVLPYTDVPGVTKVNDDDGLPNRFLIPAASLATERDFFRVEIE